MSPGSSRISPNTVVFGPSSSSRGVSPPPNANTRMPAARAACTARSVGASGVRYYRETIKTITGARFIQELAAIFATLAGQEDPLADGAPLAQLGYHPDQPPGDSRVRV